MFPNPGVTTFHSEPLVKGLKALVTALPVVVIVKLVPLFAVELSFIVDDWQVNRTVFAIAVNADVGGVNDCVVYKASPLSSLKLEIYPYQFLVNVESLPILIVCGPLKLVRSP